MILLTVAAVALTSCASFEVGGSPPITNQAPPGAKISGGGTTSEVPRGQSFTTEAGHRVEYQGWTEWPFPWLDNNLRQEIAMSTINTTDRILYVRVASCVAETTSTPVHQWGLLERDGAVLNSGYTTVSFSWLEPVHRQPAAGDCSEGWLGMPIDQSANPHSVEWSDPLTGERTTWYLGSELLAADTSPVEPTETALDLGTSGDGPDGSSWTIRQVASVEFHPRQELLTASLPQLPVDTDWWFVEAEYCAPDAEVTVFGTPELALEGWFVGNSLGRHSNPLVPSEMLVPSDSLVPSEMLVGETGVSCLLVVDMFPVPAGLTPNFVRIVGDAGRTIWRITS